MLTAAYELGKDRVITRDREMFSTRTVHLYLQETNGGWDIWDNHTLCIDIIYRT